MPACHAGGHGFKARRHRQLKKKERGNYMKKARFEFNFYPDESLHEYPTVCLSFELPHDCSSDDIYPFYRSFLAAMGYPELREESRNYETATNND